ncbi:unnamed protein product [Polarella glacialis]|uniref:Bestrophin homolog n=1 Tax=Polarella glacialis TaxID=89957 RepID=A0A813LJM9_POLGL|nr:unnamed protein product [Polarella glacialis]
MLAMEPVRGHGCLQHHPQQQQQQQRRQQQWAAARYVPDQRQACVVHPWIVGLALGCSSLACSRKPGQRRRKLGSNNNQNNNNNNKNNSKNNNNSRRRIARRSLSDYPESRPSGESVAKFCESRDFNPEEWRQHASPTRYLLELGGLFFGSTTRRVFPVIAVLALWSVLVEQYHRLQMQTPNLPEIVLPLVPFELTAPLLGLLLVFRTDKSYERHRDGLDSIWAISGKLSNLMTGLLSSTSDKRARDPEDVSDACRLIVDYHQWLCMAYLLQDPSGVEGLETDGTSLGPDSVKSLNQQLGRRETASLSPAHVQLAIAQAINQVPRLNEQQRQGFDTILWDITSQLVRCERLLRAPIPLGYTRSTLRFMWLWLMLLPFALSKTFEDVEQRHMLTMELQIETPAVVFFIGLLFLSLEDVAVQIEEPFAMQMKQLSSLTQWFRKEALELEEIAQLKHAHFYQAKQEGEKG